MMDLHLAPVPLPRLRAAVALAALLLCVSAAAPPAATAAATPTPVASAPSAAAGRATFGIKPSHATLGEPIDERPRFEYTATPGAQQPDYVAISNNSLTRLRLNLYASDGFNTASDGFDLLAASKKPVDVGSWITLKTNVVDLAPGASVVVPFTVKVPFKVSPGDHVGGIVASLRTYGVDKKGDRVAIDQRVGSRVYLRIQGPLDARLAISNLKAEYQRTWWNPFSSGKVTLSYTVRNPGNVRLGAHGAAAVSGWYGSAHSASAPDIPELLPDNSHSDVVVVSRVTPAVRDTATVTITSFSLPGDTDGRLTAVAMTVHFWAVPWGLLILLVIFLALPAVGWRVIRRRRRKASAAPSPSATDVQRTNAGAQP
jgi:hypothetical protein